MTIEEIEKWLIKKEESFDMNQIPPPTHKIIRDLLAQVREAKKTAEDWRKYHDAEYADRKKYRKEANELFAELKEARKQAFLEAAEMAIENQEVVSQFATVRECLSYNEACREIAGQLRRKAGEA